MQKTLYLSLLIFLFFIGKMQAQIVNIPNANFKNKLIALGIDTNNDGNIQKTEATMVTNLDVSNSNISSLVGIEAFTNLTHLRCQMNNLGNLYVDSLINLTYLACNNNILSSLVITNCTNLDTLLAQSTGIGTLLCTGLNLSYLNVTNCGSLQALECGQNQLTSLDLFGCHILQQLDISHNQIANLTGLYFSPGLTLFNGSYNPLTSFSSSMNHNSNNNTINVSNCPNLQTLSIGEVNYLNVTGCTSLQTLQCTSSNYLSSLDVSTCISLVTLQCGYNQITNLNLTNCSNLQTLMCDNNLLSNLDISANPNLQFLECSSNQLQVINLPAANGLLQTINCANNQLTTLNVSALSSLQVIDCQYNPLTLLVTPSSLTHLYVSSSLITDLDVSGCSNLIVLEMYSCPNLQTLNCEGTQVPNFDLTTCPNITSFNCSNGFGGVYVDINASNCVNLTNINCENTDISTFNFTGCTALQSVNLLNTSYISAPNTLMLDLSICPNLTYVGINGSSVTHLYCQGTPLTTLDVGNAMLLRELDCANCQLTNLSLSNALGIGPPLEYLDCSYNQIQNFAFPIIAGGNVNLSNNPFAVLDLSQSPGIMDLDVSNCPNLTHFLYLTGTPTSLNVQGCTNLQSLICANDQLLSLDVSGLTNLVYLNCGGSVGFLSTLTTTGCTSLKTIYCQYSSIDSLDVTSCTSLDTLVCHNNILQSLLVNNLSNLVYLDFSENYSVSNIDLTGCTNLTTLRANYASIPSLDLSPCPNLTRLEFIENQLTTLDISPCPNLSYLSCENNQLTAIDISPCPNLAYLSLHSNQLANLDLALNTNLHYVSCGYNQLTNLDLHNSINLDTILCQYNLFTNFDISNLTQLKISDVTGNPLESILMKNGVYDDNLFFFDTPTLYICCDASELNAFQQWPHLCSINSLCTYSPGGGYNTISGNTILDINSNGCSASDPAYKFLLMSVSDGTSINYLTSNDLGNYSAFADSGAYTFSPIFQNPTYFSSPPSNINFANNNNNQQTQDFCITPAGIFPDVEVSVIPLNIARPGFYTTYNLLFRNKGTTIAAGNVSFDFMGSQMTVVNTSLTPTTQTANQLTWAYTNLLPWESRNITVEVAILPPPVNNNGQVLNFNANISLANDAALNDNTFLLPQTLVGSYDPNDKTCLQGDSLPNTMIGRELHYLVRFQNTGTFYAENVIVIDTLDANQYNIESLQVLETSHSAHIDLKNNILQFYFEGIMLQDSFTNEPESHGYVLFKIKTKANLPQNSVVKNQSAIYFDFNAPVITNTAVTTFFSTLSTTPTIEEAFFQIYPNPTQNILTVETPKAASFVMFDIMGKEVMEMQIEYGKQNINVSNLPKGMYWLKEKNSGVGLKFVKE